MPTAWGALARGFIDGKIYAMEGVGRNKNNSGANEVYDPVTNRWRRRVLIPTPRDHLAVGVVGRKLYAFGEKSTEVMPSTFRSTRNTTRRRIVGASACRC